MTNQNNTVSEKEKIVSAIRDYLDQHEKDTKPWNKYTGTELKRIIEEDILSIIEKL